MGSDRARVSFDASRHWRGVVAQQGRVTLEADVNEAETIATEENRAQLRELVGPVGTTPDDGYRIMPPPSTTDVGDFSVRHGTIYVGGVRVTLDTDILASAQPDWLDAPNEPAAAPVPQPAQQNELMYLLLREHEVGAVEDPALREVALGGPDTAARTRILQRVLRTSTAGATWTEAWAEIAVQWAGIGYVPDAATMRLDSTARLQVSFTPTPPPSACQPEAQSGYVGAENQFIRVTVSAIDANGTPTLMWGYDNASSLYRVTIPRGTSVAGTTTLTLSSSPPDATHQPQPGQAVEVLRTAAALDTAALNSTTLDSTAAIASSTGIPTTVAANGGYDPDTGNLTVATTLAAPYDTADTPVLFLRVWQDQIIAPPGTAVALGDTGVQVTLTTSDSQNHFHVGDYWTVAVRPDTPALVYPRRLLDSPQPPDGPPLWACPLGLVRWTTSTTPTVIDDPRGPFAGLVELTRGGNGAGCCTVSVSPEEVAGGGGLQALIDSFTGKGPTVICLRPGTYTLPAPLVLGPDDGNLTLEGRAGGTHLVPDPNASPQAFLQGLVLIDGADSVVFRGLQLQMPTAAFSIPQAVINALTPTTQTTVQQVFGTLSLSFGVHAVDATNLALEDCTLVFPSTATTVFAAGIFADTHLEGLRVDGCRFVAPPGGEPTTLPFADLSAGNPLSPPPPYPLLVGILQVPVTAPPGTTSTPVVTLAAQAPDPGGLFTQPDLRDAYVTRNLFEGITLPLLSWGQFGTVAVTANTVRSCYGGFWFASYTKLEYLLGIFEDIDQTHRYQGTLDDVIFVLTLVVGRSLTYTAPTTPRPIPRDTARGGQPRADDGRGIGVTTTPARTAAPPSWLGPRSGSLPGGGGSQPPPDYTVATADPGTGLSSRIEISGNQVDAVLSDSYTGPALIVLDVSGASGSAVVVGNRFRTRAPRGPVALMLGDFLQQVVTDNLISNEAVAVPAGTSAGPAVTPQSLEIIESPAGLTVTGNVLVGPTSLPGRTFTPPTGQTAPTDPFLASWDFLNTVLPALTQPSPGPGPVN